MTQEGTIDVSKDLEARTDMQATDRLLMVNPATKEVQYVEAEKFTDSVTQRVLPVFSDNISDI